MKEMAFRQAMRWAVALGAFAYSDVRILHRCSISPSRKDVLTVCGVQITYSYEGAGHELRNDQAALDYCFMLPHSDDSRLFHIDALASMTASGEVQFVENVPSCCKAGSFINVPSHCQARFALPTSLSLALQGALREFSAGELKTERAQIQALLGKFPTTLKQDREILSSMQRAGGHYFGNC